MENINQIGIHWHLLMISINVLWVYANSRVKYGEYYPTTGTLILLVLICALPIINILVFFMVIFHILVKIIETIKEDEK